MKTIKKLAFLALGTSLFFTSCNNDDNGGGHTSQGDFENGVFVLNEGGFNTNTAEVSFLSANGELEHEIYNAVNGSILGDVAQSIGIEGNKAYIVVNNSNVIRVVNRYTFELIATISSGLQNPRYIVFEDGKGYVSNWGDPLNISDDFIAVIDLNSNQVSSTISVSEGPEKMVEENGKLYVAHKGGWGTGNTISVINLSSNSVTATITVADIPDGIKEENGYLYVLCSGFDSWSSEPSTQGGLYKINLSNNEIVQELPFASGVYPSHLEIEDNKIYYTIGADVYVMELSDTNLPTNSLLSLSGSGVWSIYGFAVEDGKIYMSDPKDYNSNGEIFIYSTSGTAINSYEVGIIPNGFYFN